MGQSYSTLVGNPPSIATLAWRSWYLDLLQRRLDAVPRERATTYYFSTAGDDTASGRYPQIVNATSVAWDNVTNTFTKTGAFAEYRAAVVAGTANLGVDQVAISRSGIDLGAGAGNPVLVEIVGCPNADTLVIAERDWGTTSGYTIKGGPKKTLAAANALLTGSSPAHLRIRLRRGDKWQERNGAGFPIGLKIERSHVTVDDYGDAFKPKPKLSGFTKLASGASWTVHAGTTLKRAVSETVAWLRHEDNVRDVLVKMTSVADVEATPGSFHYDSATTTLYLNPAKGFVAPTNSWSGDYEYLKAGLVTDISSGVIVGSMSLSCDNVRVQNIRADGFGDFKSLAGGIDENLFVGCEAYYGDSHLMIKGDGAGSGGVATFVECLSGWGYAFGFNHFQDCYMLYSGGGGHEGIFHRCRSIGGKLPAGFDPLSSGNLGEAFRSHSTAPNTCGLLVVYECSVDPHPYQCPGFGAPSHCPDWVAAGDLSACRAFYVGARLPARPPGPLDSRFTGAILRAAGSLGNPNGVVWVNSELDLSPWVSATGTPTTALSNADTGTHLNTTLVVDFRALPGGGTNSIFTGSSRGFWFNSRLHLLASNTFGVPPGGLALGAKSIDMWAANCLFSAELGTPRISFDPSLHDNSDLAAGDMSPKRFRNNGYAGARDRTFWANDDVASEWADAPLNSEAFEVPASSDQKVGAIYSGPPQSGTLVHAGYRLEYDRDWRPRPADTPTLGPRAAESASAAPPVLIGNSAPRRFPAF